MTLRLYTLAFRLLLPLVLLRLLWRGRRAPAYHRRWRERFGLCPWRLDDGCIWLHAVSVGEVEAAAPLVEAIVRRHPDRTLVVTTTTPTGSDRVRQAFGDRVLHAYLPYDLPGAIGRFLDRSRPSLLIVMETEIWPNLFRLCERRSIPTIIANARLSERSARRYRRLGRLIRETLTHCRLIACQGEADARRFAELGCDAERLTVTGNIKFDRPLPTDLEQRADSIRSLWRSDARGDSDRRPVWLAASTHEGEEALCLEAFERCLERIPDLLLVVVPRHPERFGPVERLCRRTGHRVLLRSRTRPGEAASARILIGDTMGELLAFYAACDVAFVGGSLVPTGGHNVLEPAALGRPIVFGTEMFNFATIARDLLAREAATEVNSAETLADAVTTLFDDPDLRRRMGARAREAFEANRGGLERTLRLIERSLRP